jgi:predicted MFS family arabinose efflux permease
VPFFALGGTIYITLISVLFSCVGFNFVILNMVTQLSHHYPKTPDLAVSQSNAINSIGYVIGTIAVGTLATYNISWRLALLLCVPAALVLYIFGRDKIVDAHDHEAPKQIGKLGGKFWIAWVGFFATIASEFATAFWAATLITERTGADPAISTLCIAALGTGMGIGRWFIPIWLRKTTLENRLKTILITQFLAFMVFWFSHDLEVSLIALLFIGLGISGQFSMSSVRLIKLSDNRPDLAMSKAAYAGGLAIASSPFGLAFLGDQIGISRAYLMVPVLITVAFLAMVLVESESSSQAQISR